MPSPRQVQLRFQLAGTLLAVFVEVDYQDPEFILYAHGPPFPEQVPHGNTQPSAFLELSAPGLVLFEDLPSPLGTIRQVADPNSLLVFMKEQFLLKLIIEVPAQVFPQADAASS